VSSIPCGSGLGPTFGCNQTNDREGPGREGDPTTLGGNSLERRKPRRAPARGSAKPRNAGTASRREQYPVGGFPCSFFVSLIWNQPRTIQPGWRWSNLRPDLRSASADRGPDLTATSDPVALRGLDPKGSASARCRARGETPNCIAWPQGHSIPCTWGVTTRLGASPLHRHPGGRPGRGSGNRTAFTRARGNSCGVVFGRHQVDRLGSDSAVVTGLGLPRPSARTDAVPGPQWPPSPPVGADARMVRAPDKDTSQAGLETTRGYPTPRGVRISGKINALEGATPRAPPARNKAGRDRSGV
jgi:hypothetical protein